MHLRWTGDDYEGDADTLHNAFHLIHYFLNCNEYNVNGWQDAEGTVFFEFLTLADAKIEDFLRDDLLTTSLHTSAIGIVSINPFCEGSLYHIVKLKIPGGARQ